MSAKLVAYEYVPSGFEMVVENKQVKAWNLWWNVKLTDDPEAWDSEIKSINEMQGKLGELASDQRLIRAQMAEFCREHPLFPQSIDILCEEIGDGRFSHPVKVGCEGRGLLDSLGHHDPKTLSDQWEETLGAYARSLRKWLVRGRVDWENPIESKVFHFLGQPADSKEAFVEKLISVLDSEGPSISSLKELVEDKCRESHGQSVFVTPGHPLSCFSCQDGCPERRCMILDAGLLCAQIPGEKRSIVEQFRRFVEENVLAYAVAINSWLNEVPSKHVTSLITARYIAEDNALETPKRVYSSLGEKDEAKVWLTACLLKTIKDNQRWHRRTELIDDFPEATSWFVPSAQEGLTGKQGGE